MATPGGTAIAARFGDNLRHARKDAGLSQEEAGIRASLHRTEIGLLERGERIPRIDTLVKLAGAVGAPVDDLLVGLGWEPAETQPGRFTVLTRKEQLDAALERAAALRAKQTKEFDVAKEVRDSREGLDRRGEDA
jgi:transcriptional regulator with XRE-family HTH domain